MVGRGVYGMSGYGVAKMGRVDSMGDYGAVAGDGGVGVDVRES